MNKTTSKWYLIMCKRPQHFLATFLTMTLFLAMLALMASEQRQQQSLNEDLLKVETKYFKFPFCHCERKMEVRKGAKRIPSSCNDYATARGPGQKIVSYSLYGDSQDPEVAKKYFSQIGERAKEVETKYPGWVMRVYYHNLEDDFEGLREMCPLFCQHRNLDLCDVDNLPQPFGDFRGAQRIGRLWRFAVMMDPLVDAFVSRDLDAVVLDREVSAVKEWLDSNKTFHIMRDHPSHNGHMMAGLWGARMRNDKTREKVARAGSDIVEQEPRDTWDYDQVLLRRLVWPLARSDSLQHDSYTCNAKAFLTSSQEKISTFPSQRKGNTYVGWGPSKGRSQVKECPQSCRRKQSWKYC